MLDCISIQDPYQLLKPAALYEEALARVREERVAYRSLRYLRRHKKKKKRHHLFAFSSSKDQCYCVNSEEKRIVLS